MKILGLIILLSGAVNAADFRPYSMSGSAGDSRYVNVSGDTMTGPLTLSGSTLTVTGNAFSVGRSTLAVIAGLTSIGSYTGFNPFQSRAVDGLLIVSTGNYYGGLVRTLNSRHLAPSVNGNGSYIEFGMSTTDDTGVMIGGVRTGVSGIGDIFFKTMPTASAGDPFMQVERMRITNTGNVGIGVTNPTGLFQVGGGSLTVLSNGNVGIGTTAPGTNLSVVGTTGIKMSTATTSTDSMCFVGAVDTLPATGYGRGCLAYLTSAPTSLYISTETVAGAWSWLAK